MIKFRLFEAEIIALMTELTKIIIPVAGLGTRVLPASKAIPKEMLTIVDKPVIQHVVEEAIAAGFREIVLITRAGKSAIENHFDSHYELETELANKNHTHLLERVKNIVPTNVSISSVRQYRPLGLGHAILCAAPVIGNSPFAVMLPDVLIYHGTESNSFDLSAMVSAYHQTGLTQIMVKSVPMDKVSQYGIVDCAGKTFGPGQRHPIAGMIEKPDTQSAPSNQAIVGRYILPARVMEILKTIPPGAGGEIQLTDALDQLLQETSAEAYSMTAGTFDCGSKQGYLQANFILGLANAETGDEFRSFVEQHLG